METNVKAIELQDLWRRYKDDGDERARERLVVAYSPLVKFVAGRMASGLPSHVEEADLISYGLVGLIGAIERFEPEREIKFETFAITRIRARSSTSCARSTGCRARSAPAPARSSGANAKLEHQLQRAPTDEEMAARARASTMEEFQDVAAADLQLLGRRARRAVDRLGLLRRPGLAARHDRTTRDAPDPQESLDAAELKDRLADAIAAPARAREARVALYYYENLTLREIGEVLGVTESRVSQLHTKAVLRLQVRACRRDRLTAY